MPATGWVISSIVVAVLGSVFVGGIASMEKKVVRDKWGKIDFTRPHFPASLLFRSYFYKRRD